MLKHGVSIVMPCLNEEKTVAICIRKAFEFLANVNMEGEVIVADNGSSDNSVCLAEQNGARVVLVQEKGYGAAVRGGIEKAEYQYIVMGDADDSYDFLNLHEFIRKMDEGFDLVMGNRFAGGIEKGAMPFSHRYIGNPFLSGLGRIFFKTKIKDFHCGLRAFQKSSIMKLDLCTTGMEFASEMVVKACLFDLKIAEIPCKLYPDGRDRAPHLRSISDGMRHLEFLMIYSPKWLFAYPGAVLFMAGAAFMLALYIQPLQIGEVQFEITTMLYAAIAMLIGTQMLQFSVFTEIFAKRVGQLPKKAKLVQRMEGIFRKRGYWISILLGSIGLIGVIYTLFIWGKTGFGQLENNYVCKTAILFGSFLALGAELFLFTVFLRILNIGRS